ncbi:hypothetical protein Tco_1241224, partial [Tanacetum coccineum]
SDLYTCDQGILVRNEAIINPSNPTIKQENSSINSNTNLAVYGQGLLRLSGQVDAIRAQTFAHYSIT